MRGEGVAPGSVEVPTEASDPTEDGDRRQFEIRALSGPGVDQVVDLVAAIRTQGHLPRLTVNVAIKNLDVETSCRASIPASYGCAHD